MTPRRGEVWTAHLDPVVGSEQGGTRPVVIVSNDYFNNLAPIHAVVPVTSRRPGRALHPSEVGVAAGTASLRSDSIILCQQVRTVSRARLGKRIGALDGAVVDEVDEALRVHLSV